MSIIEGVDASQNSRLTIIEGVNSAQNTSISAVDAYATGAYGKANSANVLAQASFDAGNTSATLQSGINSTQNTNISAVDTYAGSAYNKANNALPLTGGSITGSLSVSQDLSVSGNLTVLGTTTTINTSSLVVNDSLLVLGVGNYVSDALDLGFSGHYNDGTNAHAGIIRDAGTKEFYVFKGYTPEHSANNNIDINHASFAKANVNADYVKGNLITNGVNIYTHTGAAFAQANTNAEQITIIQGVNSAQNTSILSVDTFAGAAYNKANSANVLAQAAFDVANTAAAGSVDQTARTTANNASSNTIIIQGVDVSQNARISIIEGVNSAQNTSISAIDTYATGAYGKANASGVLAQASFDSANTNATNITIIQGVDVGQNTRMTIIEGVDVGQNTRIIAVDTYATGAFDKANSANVLAQAAFNAANNAQGTVGYLAFAKANGAYDQANTATTLAQAAFNAANTSAGSVGYLAFDKANAAFDAANTNALQITAIQGVNTTQNTNITITSNAATSAFTKANSANVLAQAAFDAANSISLGAISNVALTHSNSAIGTIPVTNSLKPGEPSINLNDGRMFIQLNNGQIIDISSTAAGNTWHVTMNGNDNFKGDTPSSAKASIRAAVAAAQPGDSVVVHSGTYNEITPIIIPQNVQLQGSGERTCLIKPTTSSNNVFYVNNNSYVTGFKFVDYTGIAVSFPPRVLETGTAQTLAPGSANTIIFNSGASVYTDYYKSMLVTITGGTGSGQSANIISYNGTTKTATVDADWSTQPDGTSVYSLSIPLRTSPASSTSRYTTYITGSPYVYNSSSVTTTGTGIKIDGDLATGNKSIISAQFTQVNSGGTGVHILNDGYAQLVSIYGIFCDTAFLAESGGTASLGNCNVNFGNRGLVANGKGKLAMTATVANTSSQASLTIDLNTVVANSSLGVTATRPYVGLIMIIDTEPENYHIVTEATELAGGSTTVTFQSTIANTISSGTTVKFYQQSQLRASGQTFEYVGAGTSIAAIPRLGGIANSAAQIITIGEGAVFATATDQSGNFSVSDLTINQSTSTITGRTFSKSLFAEMTPYILALES